MELIDTKTLKIKTIETLRNRMERAEKDARKKKFDDMITVIDASPVDDDTKKALKDSVQQRLGDKEISVSIGDIASVDLSQYDLAEVKTTPQPTINPAIEVAEESAPALVNGEYVKLWTVRPKTAAELKSASREKFNELRDNGQALEDILDYIQDVSKVQGMPPLSNGIRNAIKLMKGN